MRSINQRREDRTPVKPQLVTAIILDSEMEPFIARLTNYCPVGVQLITDQRLPVGGAVKVQWGGALILGEVIYCTSVAEGFCTGIEVNNLVFGTH